MLGGGESPRVHDSHRGIESRRLHQTSVDEGYLDSGSGVLVVIPSETLQYSLRAHSSAFCKRSSCCSFRWTAGSRRTLRIASAASRNSSGFAILSSYVSSHRQKGVTTIT